MAGEHKVIQRVPFDSICLQLICQELNQYLGSKVQRVVQPSSTTLEVELYGGPERGIVILLFDIHPETCRIHFVTRHQRAQKIPSVFCMTCRARFESGILTSVVQVANDRIIKLTFSNEEIKHVLIAEIMGKHSNLILTESSGRIIASAKWVDRKQRRRPIQPNTIYELPPVMKDTERLTSPFFEANFLSRRDDNEQSQLLSNLGQGFLVRTRGAYPLSLDKVFPKESQEKKKSLSIALEIYHDNLQHELVTEKLRFRCMKVLEKARSSLGYTISNIKEALIQGSREIEYQTYGQLLFTYQPTLLEGSTEIDLPGPDGTVVCIPIDSDKTLIENANSYFARAKRVRQRKPELEKHLEKLSNEFSQVLDLISLVKNASEKELNEILNLKSLKRFTQVDNCKELQGKKENSRKYRIREIQGPGQCVILYGENAESNDYLTLRIAKPNDYWFHVRGNVSAHVVILTQNHPEKIGSDALYFAARIAARNSGSKHSKVVPVDYTLKKYVRKPKGTPFGTVFYTNEKTLHIEDSLAH